MKKDIHTLIFDLGGVLIDWNPRHLYKRWFRREEEMEYFLSHICSSAWNEQQDAGRSFKEATAIVIRDFPDFEKEILAYDQEWDKMINGKIEASVALLEKLAASGKYRLYALTK